MAHTTNLILGLDVGGTKSAVVVGSADGKILAREEFASDARRGPDAMIEQLFAHAKTLRAKFPAVSSAGVSIGGPMDALHGVIQSPPHLPGWDNIPLADRLSEALALPVVVEHDAIACLLAEWLWGEARGTTHCAYFTCGTGFGAGMMIGRQIVRGPGGRSPEFGHVRLAADGPMMFGKAGCCESFCGGDGISLLAQFLFPKRFTGSVAPAELVRLGDAGDGQAGAVLMESARRCGQAAAILADLFCPQVIVLGSLARRFGPGWVAAVRESFAAEALPINSGATRIAAYALDNMQDLSPIAAAVYRLSPAIRE
jgi:glucokinase